MSLYIYMSSLTFLKLPGISSLTQAAIGKTITENEQMQDA